MIFKDFFKLENVDNRVFGLDLLRTIAILLVLFSHSLGYLPSYFSKKISPFIIDGVAVFFVLSGFLIGGIMIRNFQNNISPSLLLKFWIRRWFRTLPLYFLILTFLVFLDILSQNCYLKIPYYKYYLFIQNFNSPMLDFFPESWSLSVEEWFYLLFPVAFITLAKIMPKSILYKDVFLLVIILTIITITFWRGYRYFNLEQKSYRIFDRYFLREVTTRLDAIVFGVIGAWIKYYFPAIWKKSKSMNIILLILGILIIFFQHLTEKKNDLMLYVFGFGITSIGVLLTLPFFDNWKNCTSVFLTKNIPVVHYEIKK